MGARGLKGTWGWGGGGKGVKGAGGGGGGWGGGKWNEFKGRLRGVQIICVHICVCMCAFYPKSSLCRICLFLNLNVSTLFC